MNGEEEVGEDQEIGEGEVFEEVVQEEEGEDEYVKDAGNEELDGCKKVYGKVVEHGMLV